jgi:glycerophosphoryl diester phosphodiesterase
MALVILIHAVIFLVFWLTNLPYQETLNNFLISATGRRANFLLIFIIFAGLAALWSTVRLVLRDEARRSGPAWLFLAIGAFFLVFFYGSFVFLFIKNPAQLSRLGQLFWYFRLFVDACLLLFIAWGLGRWLNIDGSLKKVIIPAILLVLWLIPVLWHPGNVYRGVLPEKPRVIAHRGASTLAPENTLGSMQAAAGLGVYGLETDIDISADGVLFLMHDNTLERTTDVVQVFPGREDDPAETFTWEELSHLKAVSGFDGRSVSFGEPIPTLESMLQVVKGNHLYFIYDLRSPAAGHPYTGQTLDLCLEEIRTAGITDHTWVLTEPGAIPQIRTILPDVILAAGLDYTDIPPSPASLVANGYRVVNSVFSLSDRKIQAYQASGLWVNLWVVDEAWQYSRLWLAGADSVTTNNPQGLLSLSRPVLAMPYNIYLLIWGLLGVMAAFTCWWTALK